MSSTQLFGQHNNRIKAFAFDSLGRNTVTRLSAPYAGRYVYKI